MAQDDIKKRISMAQPASGLLPVKSRYRDQPKLNAENNVIADTEDSIHSILVYK